MELQEEVIFDKNDSMNGKELYAFIEGKLQMKMLMLVVHIGMLRM